MDGKLFRYELKKIGKFPLFIAAGYAAVWLLCGVCSKFGYNSLDYADFFAEIFLYAAFFFAAGNAIWRTAALRQAVPQGEEGPEGPALRAAARRRGLPFGGRPALSAAGDGDGPDRPLRPPGANGGGARGDDVHAVSAQPLLLPVSAVRGDGGEWCSSPRRPCPSTR